MRNQETQISNLRIEIEEKNTPSIEILKEIPPQSPINSQEKQHEEKEQFTVFSAFSFSIEDIRASLWNQKRTKMKK